MLPSYVLLVRVSISRSQNGKNSPVGNIIISFPGANFFYYCLIFTCLIPKEKGADAISIRSKDKRIGKDQSSNRNTAFPGINLETGSAQ